MYFVIRNVDGGGYYATRQEALHEYNQSVDAYDGEDCTGLIAVDYNFRLGRVLKSKSDFKKIWLHLEFLSSHDLSLKEPINEGCIFFDEDKAMRWTCEYDMGREWLEVDYINRTAKIIEFDCCD